MARTDSFRKQHQDIVTVVKAISSKLNPAAVEADSPGIRALMSQLMGKLNVHLAMEDKALYPNMLEAKDAHIIATTKRYIAEMGGISAAAKKYSEAYPSAQSITANSGNFIRDSNGLFSALSARVQREESELYPMADKM
jgi:hypothetical protein